MELRKKLDWRIGAAPYVEEFQMMNSQKEYLYDIIIFEDFYQYVYEKRKAFGVSLIVVRNTGMPVHQTCSFAELLKGKEQPSFNTYVNEHIKHLKVSQIQEKDRIYFTECCHLNAECSPDKFLYGKHSVNAGPSVKNTAGGSASDFFIVGFERGKTIEGWYLS